MVLLLYLLSGFFALWGEKARQQCKFALIRIEAVTPRHSTRQHSQRYFFFFCFRFSLCERKNENRFHSQFAQRAPDSQFSRSPSPRDRFIIQHTRDHRQEGARSWTL